MSNVKGWETKAVEKQELMELEKLRTFSETHRAGCKCCRTRKDACIPQVTRTSMRNCRRHKETVLGPVIL